MLFPAKNKIQTINEVEEIVDNGKVKITPDNWYALVYAAYQINAIQDLVSTGFKGNAIKNISVRSGAVTSDGSPTFDFTFTYQGGDGQEVTTTATAEIPVSTIPSTPGAEGAVGPKGDSVFIKYSANSDGTGFTNSWTEGQSYIGIAVAQIEPANKTEYIWTKFIDKRITGLRFNGTNLVFTWSEGPETTVTMQTSDFKTVKPVEGVVTSVNGMTGAVKTGIVSVPFDIDSVYFHTKREIADIPEGKTFKDLFAVGIKYFDASDSVYSAIIYRAGEESAYLDLSTTNVDVMGSNDWINVQYTTTISLTRSANKISIELSRYAKVVHDLETNEFRIIDKKKLYTDKISTVIGTLYFK